MTVMNLKHQPSCANTVNFPDKLHENATCIFLETHILQTVNPPQKVWTYPKPRGSAGITPLQTAAMTHQNKEACGPWVQGCWQGVGVLGFGNLRALPVASKPCTKL